MQYLTSHHNPRMAQAYVDFMATYGVEINIAKQDGGVALWVVEDDNFKLAQFHWQEFIANPYDEKYSNASWQMADTRTNAFSYQMPSFLAQLNDQSGIITLSISALCIVIYALMNLGFKLDIFILLHFPSLPDQYLQLWRWVSHAFMHFSILHIVFNLLWFWQLGGQIEQKIGKFKLVQLIVISSALSGLLQYYFSGAYFGGLSGVIYALLAYTWIFSVKCPAKRLYIEHNVGVFMLVWLVAGFLLPFLNIANMAHLGGLITGALIALIDIQMMKKNSSANGSGWSA